jgi:HAD superfamily hydrolase (TIGR01484 family)
MRYHALACDYDGTIAWDSKVTERTVDALVDLKHSGRKLILVTGRELDDLNKVFPRLDLFDRVVAENGALLYRPSTREERKLGERPPEEFIRELIHRGAERVSVGRVIVATWRPHETTAIELIRDFGLELQIIFNKGAVMILPSGINKATGLSAALEELGLSPHNVVGIGDAENDHAFLSLCECSVAVANALDTLKERVDWVTTGGHGDGTIELVQGLIATDVAHLEPRQKLLFGKRADGSDVWVRPYGKNVLVAGTSGGGKSTLAMSFLERLEEQKYQYLIVDPEGDYSKFPGAVALGDERRPPSVSEVMDVLAKPSEDAVVNLTGVDLSERPAFFEMLLPRVQELRAKAGRPHWLVIDESHHVLPFEWETAGVTVSQRMYGVWIITLEPDRVSPAILSNIDVVIAIGEDPAATFKIFAQTVGEAAPVFKSTALNPGQAAAWFRDSSESPFVFETIPPRAERRRHRRKYAEGELAPDLCFYFRGAQGKLNLKAQNLAMFVQIADGVDDETWLFHLMNGDIARWFRGVIKDPDLAAEAEAMQRGDVTPEDSRKHIREEIERRYILAA